ncbi:MAG TPA: type II secretion system protein [Candidatus Paceibacterota bacterium]|nr:type II secretion system protein [Candidatus Paceibacterota bacterium]
MSKNLIKGSKGFTLIELLVVIAIIGILSSVVLASLSTARAKSRDARRISDVGQIQLALELYYDASSSYPIRNAVNAITASSTELGVLSPTYIPKVPTDPTASTYYVYGGTTTSYIIAAKLERGDNTALLSDSDKTGVFSFNGTSISCDNTAGTPQGQATPTELCYDVSN